MADFSAIRERQIDEMLDQLASDDPAERREAAYWAGEAAVADAVPKLVDLYEHDDDASVREAAGYALGMFRAVEIAIKQGKEKRVVKLLEQVEEKGKLGSRANKGGWIRFVLGLLIALLVFGAAYLLIPSEIVQTAQSSLVNAGVLQITPDTTRPALLQRIRTTYIAVRDDITTLQEQFQTALGGGTFDCTAYFNNPTPYTLSGSDAAAYPDIALIVRGLNEAQSNLAAAYARYDAACLEVTPLPASEVGATYAILVNAIQALPAIEMALTETNAIATSIPITLDTPAPSTPNSTIVVTDAPPTAVPPTPTPPPPTTEIVIANPRSHLTTLYAMIDNVTGQRGSLTLLEQYWGDAQRTGQSSACGETAPVIPENYTLPAADAQASPSLLQAVTLMNQGLEAIRTGWIDFTFACNSGTLSQEANDALASARTARAGFLAAEQALNIVRDAI